MKIVSSFASIFAFAAISFGVGVANAEEIQTVNVKFPFAVTVGSKTLPAGDYTISNFEVAGDTPIFVIRGSKGAAVSFASPRTTGHNHPVEKDDVVIEVTGDKHILSQLRLQGTDSVYDLIRASK